MVDFCQIWKKVCSKFKLWVGKGADFADRFVINNLKDDFAEKISPDFARYHNV